MFFKKKKKEQRKFVRLKSHCLIKYSKVKNPNRHSVRLSNVHNISMGGLLLRTSEKMRIGDPLKVTINWPKCRRPVEAYAEVVACRRIGRSRAWHLGIRFISISPQDQKAIHSRVERRTWRR